MSVKSVISNCENKEMYDEMVGWTNGLNEINQKKHYISNNAIFYEKYAKQGIKKHGHMKTSLMLYYISQEDDFNNWWHEHDTLDMFTGY